MQFPRYLFGELFRNPKVRTTHSFVKARHHTATTKQGTDECCFTAYQLHSCCTAQTRQHPISVLACKRKTPTLHLVDADRSAAPPAFKTPAEPTPTPKKLSVSSLHARSRLHRIHLSHCPYSPEFNKAEKQSASSVTARTDHIRAFTMSHSRYPLC